MDKFLLLSLLGALGFSPGLMAATSSEGCAQMLLGSQALIGTDLSVRVDEGHSSHIMIRQGLTAVHANVVSGKRARVLSAFPAGNSGVGIWVSSPQGEVKLSWLSEPVVQQPLPISHGPHPLRGVKYEVQANRSTLVIDKAVLGNVRHLREWDIDHLKPAEIQEQVTLVGPNVVIFERKSLDGRSRYRLEVLVRGGIARKLADGRVELASAQPHQPLSLVVTTLTADEPLTPFAFENILRAEYVGKVSAEQLKLFSFLLYKEKFLAGSWTYLTYFGRDTLMTLMMLMKALKPSVIEAMLGSVLDRMSLTGDVTHEEALSDYAAYMRMKNGDAPDSSPVYDRKMIDDDFMFLAVLERYLRNADRGRAQEFLARKTPTGRSYKAAIVSNIDLIHGKAEAFAQAPMWENLIAFKPGQHDGEWRDSPTGPARAKVLYDVNAAFVPASLEAASKILADSRLGIVDMERSRRLAEYARVWNANAPSYFDVTLDIDQAEEMGEHHLHRLGLKPSRKGLQEPLRFAGLGLNAEGDPIPVMHSDFSFRMVFNRPNEHELEWMTDLVRKEFPFGLKSPIGLLVANPAFADEHVRDILTKDHYHGTLTWSWQQALAAEGLAEQLKRKDLSPDTRTRLEKAQRKMWDMIDRTEPYRSAELWTWKNVEGEMVYQPYGAEEGHHLESNPNQGWSHSYIGVRNPFWD